MPAIGVLANETSAMKRVPVVLSRASGSVGGEERIGFHGLDRHLSDCADRIG
jgi:hypothetical protein